MRASAKSVTFGILSTTTFMTENHKLKAYSAAMNECLKLGSERAHERRNWVSGSSQAGVVKARNQKLESARHTPNKPMRDVLSVSMNARSVARTC